ncbi:hypothetical protein F5Y19DRAFT_473062 [Xylariaceae sp. FL1651]|nr:hypothetical protein F5Y19DRAFT_473062 [Xylariaceae sp. FL1651]
MSTNRFGLCGRSRTVEGADFVHTRLGLDEAPELVVSKCKPMAMYLAEIYEKHTDTISTVIVNLTGTKGGSPTQYQRRSDRDLNGEDDHREGLLYVDGYLDQHQC